MIKKRSITVILLTIISFTLSAQIADQIRSYVDSTEIMVNNGRKMLLETISNNDLLKANEIYNYLEDITRNKNYSAFEYNEDLFLNILFGDWSATTRLMSDYNNEVNRYTYPNTVQLGSLLYELVSSKSESLLADCLNAGIDGESYNLIDIFLYLLKTGEVDQEYSMMVKEFKKQYNPSIYNAFISDFIPNPLIKGALAFSIGSGVNIPTGNLADSFYPAPMFNMSMDINIQKVFTSLYMCGPSFKLKTPFYITDGTATYSFDEGDAFSYFHGGMKVGYFITRNERFQFAPFATVAGTVLESQLFDTDEDGQEYQVINSFTYGLGIHAEMKIMEFDAPSYYSYYNMPGYLGLKLEAGYNLVTNAAENYFWGDIPYVTVALVFGMGDY